MPSSCCWQSSKLGEAQLSNWADWDRREPVWSFKPFALKLIKKKKKKIEKKKSPSFLQPRTCRRVFFFSFQSLLHRRSSAARTSSGVLSQHVKFGGFVFQTFNTLQFLREDIAQAEREQKESRERGSECSFARHTPLTGGPLFSSERGGWV